MITIPSTAHFAWFPLVSNTQLPYIYLISPLSVLSTLYIRNVILYLFTAALCVSKAVGGAPFKSLLGIPPM